MHFWKTWTFSKKKNIAMNTPLTLLLTLIVNATFSAKLPSNFKKCTYGSPDLSKCLAKAVESGALLLSQSMPKIGLPTLEPLDIHSFSIGAGNGPVQVQENYENAFMSGLRNIQVHDAAFSLENMSMNFTVFMPNLEITGKYHISGKVLLLPIEGRGNCTIVLTNLTAVVYFPLEKIQRKGQTHLRVTPSRQIQLPKLGRLYMKLENLFNGNKELGDVLNTLINENWSSIWDDVRSGWEIFFTETIAHIFNRFLAKVPLVEMMENVDPKIVV